MTSITRLLLTGLVAAAPRPALAQILVGSVPVSLGEGRATVLAKLRADYTVELVDTANDGWAVKSKEGPPFAFPAFLNFTRGRLSGLSRSWDLAESGDKAALQVVVNALAQLAVPDDNRCNVTTSRSAQPETEQETVTVTCGSHAVSLIVGTVKGSPTTGISETWRLVPPR